MAALVGEIRMSQELILTVKDRCARVTFNRAEARNALTSSMIRDLIDFCGAAETDPAVRCVVISGAGDHFMAGGDVKGFSATLDLSPAERQVDFERRSAEASPLFLILERMAKPVVCSVRGFAAG